jgi:hypothetical protein
MKSVTYIVGMAVMLSVGSVGALAQLAHAQDIELQIGRDGLRPVIRDRDRDREFRRDRCDEREARRAARDSGLRDPEVVRVTERRVVVEGMTRRGLDRITFANRRGCPEI